MTLITEARVRWANERPAYDAYCLAVRQEVERLVREAKIPFERITNRVKDAESLVAKMIRKGYGAYEEVTDRAGVRVVTRLARDVDAVTELISVRLGGDVEDKREGLHRLGIETFDYRATHVTISGLPNGQHAGKSCEIQIRSVCEDAWAIMSHFLAYKSPVQLPERIRRKQAVLAAMFELADAVYEEQFDAMNAHPDLGAWKLAERLELEFRALVDRPSDRELTIDVVSALLPLYEDDPSSALEAATRAVSQHGGELSLRLSRADEPERSAFLGQPEVLLVYDRLLARSLDLPRRWDAKFAPEELDLLATDLGLEVNR